MRALFTLVVLAGAAAACQNDDELKSRYRAEKHRECVDGLRRHPNSARLDVERLCGCVLDRQMEGRSASELDTFVPNKQQINEWGVGCADASLRPAPLQPAPAPPPAKGGREAAEEAPKEG